MLTLIGSFNTANLARILAGQRELPLDAVHSADWLSLQIPEEPQNPHTAVIWTLPDAVLPSIQTLQAGGTIHRDDLDHDVDEFCDRLDALSIQFPTRIVINWMLPGDRLDRGLRESRPGEGIQASLWHCNLRLAERYADQPGVHLLDPTHWLICGGPDGFNRRLWYRGRIPFSIPVFQAAAREISAALDTLAGRSAKVLVVDLDNTLWGGIVGDDGWPDLVLGGHDPLGEAYLEVQQFLKACKQRGTLLAICSRNEENTALEAIRNHPEMVLKTDDFSAWRINWRDKVTNLRELAEELNLGLDSFIFIDDSPLERAQVRENLPEVHVADWPDDPLAAPAMLRSLPGLDSISLTREDQSRTASYQAEKQRRQAASTSTPEQWLSSLLLKVEFRPLNPDDLPRTAQLFNKTNQMNLSTRRLPAAELAHWAEQPGRCLQTVRVSDRFGDLGLVGIFSLEKTDSGNRLVDFLLSCRAFGRGVEETMLAVAIELTRNAQGKLLTARIHPTEKNLPCRNFFQKCSPDTTSLEFVFDCSLSHPAVPDHVRLIKTGS